MSTSTGGHRELASRGRRGTRRVVAPLAWTLTGMCSAVKHATLAGCAGTRGRPKSKCSVWKSRLGAPSAGGSTKSPMTSRGGSTPSASSSARVSLHASSGRAKGPASHATPVESRARCPSDASRPFIGITVSGFELFDQPVLLRQEPAVVLTRATAIVSALTRSARKASASSACWSSALEHPLARLSE